MLWICCDQKTSDTTDGVTQPPPPHPQETPIGGSVVLIVESTFLRTYDGGRPNLSLLLVLGQMHLFEDLCALLHHQSLLVGVG